MLKPIDIVVLSGLLIPGGAARTQVELAQRLHLSQATIHRSLRQLERSGLWRRGTPQRGAIRELLVHGVRYVFPVELGAAARGLATAHAGPGLGDNLAREQPYVWPCEEARTFGPSLTPLHPSVPAAALEDPALYELLALIEVFRVGRARERRHAQARLEAILELESP